MTAAPTRTTWTSPCASPTGTASMRAGARPRSAASCSASASPTTSKSSIGAPKEQARITIKPDGRRRHHRHPAGRARPRDQLCASRLGSAGGAGRERQHHHGRHRRGARRRRHAFGPLHAPRRDRVLACRDDADRQRQAHRRASARHRAEVDFNDGRFTARGTNRSFDFLELAQEMEKHALPDDLAKRPRRRHRQ